MTSVRCVVNFCVAFLPLQGKTYSATEDPGVISVTRIYNYYKVGVGLN